MATKRPRSSRSYRLDQPFCLTEFLRRLSEVLGYPLDDKYRAEPGHLPVRGWIRRDPSDFAVDWLFHHILSKYDDGVSSEQKRATALEKFFQAERICERINNRFVNHYPSPYLEAWALPSLIDAAERKISGILGVYEDELTVPYRGFGPGATTRLPRVRSDVAYKYSGCPETTFQNLELAVASISTNALWQEAIKLDGNYLVLVRGNKVITVPKNYKTDRVIAVEPDLNLYVQKGIGGLIRSRLKKHGIDLTDQTRNQEMARYGSARGTLATIDLSMASDTISYEVVKRLLPPDWFDAMSKCRSPEGRLNRRTFKYEKFSSMGNGYTFELESLIFYGLALAVADVFDIPSELVSVYGDDIICPSTMAPLLIDLLDFAGFTTNEDKSFLSGDFRESCGKHYLGGHDVTPFYVRRPIEHMSDLFLVHNNLWRWAIVQRKLPDLLPLLGWIRSHALKGWRRPRIPDGYGDGAFIGTFDQAVPVLFGRGYEGYKVEVLTKKKLRRNIYLPGRIVSSLLQTGVPFTPVDSRILTNVTRWGTETICVPVWRDF